METMHRFKVSVILISSATGCQNEGCEVFAAAIYAIGKVEQYSRIESNGDVCPIWLFIEHS